MVTLELEPSVESLLAKAAKDSGMTEAQFARDAILEALAEQDGAQVALERLASPGSLHTLEEVKRELGL